MGAVQRVTCHVHAESGSFGDLQPRALTVFDRARISVDIFVARARNASRDGASGEIDLRLATSRIALVKWKVVAGNRNALLDVTSPKAAVGSHGAK